MIFNGQNYIKNREKLKLAISILDIIIINFQDMLRKVTQNKTNII